MLISFWTILLGFWVTLQRKEKKTLQTVMRRCKISLSIITGTWASHIFPLPGPWSCWHWAAGIWKFHLGALNNTLTAPENAPPAAFLIPGISPAIKTFLRCLRKGIFPLSPSPSWKSLSVHLFGFILQKILLQAISASLQSLLCSDSTK